MSSNCAHSPSADVQLCKEEKSCSVVHEPVRYDMKLKLAVCFLLYTSKGGGGGGGGGVGGEERREGHTF